MRSFSVLALLPCASALGAGVWKDPHHYVDDNSLAGLRIVSESPSGILTLLFTDDGTEWVACTGTSSGDEITIDLTNKGFPDVIVTAKHATGSQPTDQSISFPDDGNVWTMMDKPTPAFQNGDGLNDHVGIFFDPGHFTDFDSWAGFRFIAEQPASELHMVGSDDGVWMNFWYLQGSSSGSQVQFDFSPKGGPADLEGTWSTTPAAITWPDGNSWTKVPAAAAVVQPELSDNDRSGGINGMTMGGVLIVLALAYGGYSFNKAKKAAAEGGVELTAAVWAEGVAREAAIKAKEAQKKAKEAKSAYDAKQAAKHATATPMQAVPSPTASAV